MTRGLAWIGLVAALSGTLAGCDGMTATSVTDPARSTGLPFPVNDDEVETPNSLPPGFTTINPIAPETGVVGVTHMPP